MAPDREMLELASRHVVEADARIDSQRRLIARLERGGHPTELAHQLLTSLIATREQMQAHRDYLEAQARNG